MSELLVALLRNDAPPPGDADPRWPEALALAARHGIAPLLHATVQGLPPGATAGLRRERTTALRESLWREPGLRRALEALPDAVVLKGAAWASELYESPELRPCADIDLLHPTARDLPSYAWHPHPGVRAQEARPGWHERTFIDPRDPRVVIDLHTAFSQRERTAVDVAELCARARPGRLGFRVLDPDDAVLAQALSLATHELRSPLIAVVDFARLWRRCNPAIVRARAQQYRVCGALWAALRLLSRCAGDAGQFGGVAVEPALRVELGFFARLMLRWTVSRYDLSRRQPGRVEQLLRKTFFIDRPRDRVRFALAEARRRVAAGLSRG